MNPPLPPSTAPQSPPPGDPPSADINDTEGRRFARAHHILLLFCGLALLVWLLSGIYKVNADEIAIVERLGQYQTTAQGKAITIGQGLQYHLPWPIDRVHKIAIKQTRTLVVRTFNEPPDANAEFKKKAQQAFLSPQVINAIYDPYLITGDKNVVHMEAAVTYSIDHPEDWLNAVAHNPNETPGTPGQREELFQRLVEHAMTAQLARLSVENVLMEGQDRLPSILNSAISAAMDLPDPRDPTGKAKIDLGIRVEKVDVTRARPPDYVEPAFAEVFRARAKMQTLRLQGEAARQNAINKAAADATSLTLKAQGYKSQTIDAAKGEASRFAQIYEQYRAAPDVTRWAVYVDAVRSVSRDANRIIFAQPGQHTWITIDPPKPDVGQAPAK